MINITVLGYCSGLSPKYNTTSYVLETDMGKILFDCGPGVVQQLKRANILASDISLVVVSHCHTDHTLEFPYFLFANQMDRMLGNNGPDNVPVIALGEVYKGLMDMVAFTCPGGNFPFAFPNWTASEDGYSTFDFQGIEITTTTVSHSVPNIGVSFKIGSTKIVFSSDTVYNESLVDCAKGCDVLVHEAFAPKDMAEFANRFGHSTAAEAGRAAQASGAKKLVLSHMMTRFIEEADLLKAEAAEYFNGEIIIPAELNKISI